MDKGEVEREAAAPRSRIVILVRAAAEIGRRHHVVARGDPVPVRFVARGHVHPAADRLRRIHGIVPIGKSAARGPSRRRRRTGRVARIGFRLAGVQIRREQSVVVVASDVEGREDGLLDRRGECVALVVRAGIDEGERCV